MPGLSAVRASDTSERQRGVIRNMLMADGFASEIVLPSMDADFQLDVQVDWQPDSKPAVLHMLHLLLLPVFPSELEDSRMTANLVVKRGSALRWRGSGNAGHRVFGGWVPLIAMRLDEKAKPVDGFFGDLGGTPYEDTVAMLVRSLISRAVADGAFAN